MYCFLRERVGFPVPGLSQFPTLALREIMILKRYKHENIVRLNCMVTDKRAFPFTEFVRY